MQTLERYDETRQFLSTLFGRYFETHDGYIELRFIRKADGVTFSKFYRLSDFEDPALKEIQDLNLTCDVYFGVNPRPLSQEKKEEDIKDVICLWVDVDAKNFEMGKPGALEAVDKFPFPANIVIDSGHGYHLYWLLEPIIAIADDAQRLEIKQTLTGIVNKINADPQPVFLNALLRLPGTNNLKDAEPLECKVIRLDTKLQAKDKFLDYRDTSYQEPKEWDGELPEFGTKRKIISLENPEKAIADVKGVEVSIQTKNRIIHGTLLQGKDADKTNSGRDMSIIVALIFNNYDYPTIRSIFFNHFLKCSGRIMKGGEATLLWDVKNALDYVHILRAELSPQARHILEIKNSAEISSAEKVIQIDQFIVRDLFEGVPPAGKGYRKKQSDQYYFFDNELKEMMNLESLDFYLYMRQRFCLIKKDFEEIKDAVKTAIQTSGAEVELYNFAHFDVGSYVLYISNNLNQIYRIDGETITTCDNGVDGVFFETDLLTESFEYKSDMEVVNYFTREIEPKELPIEGGKIKFPRTTRFGLNLERFRGSLLDEFLISRASFDVDEKHDISPDEQKFLFLLHFYTLFFRSLQEEKPILVFVGLKASGKSFIATSIGKILFGSAFGPSAFPDDETSLKVLLGGNYYLVFDNLDGHIAGNVLDVLCAAATSAREMKRTLYTDRDQTSFWMDSFVALTSREPRYRREDTVRRLVLLHTKEIVQAVGRSDLWRTLLEQRDAIMTEILVNLNSVVKMLRQRRREPAKYCVCGMIADWETLLRKMCGVLPEAQLLFGCLLKMQERKVMFTLEEELIYWVLKHIVYELREAIERKTAAMLFERFCQVAAMLGFKDFEKRYTSPMSLSKRIRNLYGELEKEFLVEVETRHQSALYSFAPLDEEYREGAKVEEKQPTEEPLKEETDEEETSMSIAERLERLRKRQLEKQQLKKEREPGEEG